MPHQAPLEELQQLGQSLYRKKNYDKALQVFNQVWFLAHVIFMRSCYANRQAIKALQNLAIPSASLLDNRAAVHEKLNDLQAALQDAQQAIRLHKKDVTGYLRAAKVLQMQGKHAKALELYRYGIRNGADNAELLRGKENQLAWKLAPPKAADPFAQLPIELVEYVFREMSFRQTVNCMRVCKQWKALIGSLPDLWKKLDLSEARRPVKNTFISTCLTMSKLTIESATLRRLSDPEKAITALCKRCHNLRHVEILDGGLNSSPAVARFALATRLSSLKLGLEASVTQDAVSQLLATCPCISHLECQAVLDSPHKVDWFLDFPSLQTLKLARPVPGRGLETFNIARLLERTPALQSLTLKNFACQRELDLRPLPLKKLDLIGSVFDHNPILPQSLVSLRLDRPYPSRYQSVLANPLDGLPLLQELACVGVHDLKIFLASDRTDQAILHTLEVAPGIHHDLESEIGSYRLAGVETLTLKNWGARLEDDLVSAIVLHLKQLKHVDMSFSHVTGVGVKALVQNTQLETLNLTGCERLGIDAVEWARGQGVRVDYSIPQSSKGRKVRYG